MVLDGDKARLQLWLEDVFARLLCNSQAKEDNCSAKKQETELLDIQGLPRYVLLAHSSMCVYRSRGTAALSIYYV